MNEKKMTSIGGQAIIEGVMMRGPKEIAMAVRKPDGEIIIEKKEVKAKNKFFKIPIIRGVFAFADSMIIGVQALMFSAKFYDVDDGKPVKEDDKKEKQTLSPFMMYLSVIFSVIISVLMFIALPNFIAGIIVDKESSVTLYNLIESVVKILIFTGYLLLVSKMKDIQRVFEYHGAEHKSIFCYENGEELTISNVKKYERFHPRCGTSFLLFVMVISIIVFSIVGRTDSRILDIVIRIALMPLIAGISYEIIRFAGKNVENKCITWLSKPGLWLQRLTTREPDDSQIEVAIASLKAVIPVEKGTDEWGS